MVIPLALLGILCLGGLEGERSISQADYQLALHFENIDCDPGDGGDEGPSSPTPTCDDPEWCSSPIIIDLGNDYPEFGGIESAVFFDLIGNGIPIHLQWVRENGNEAFLVMDINMNGSVDDGSELFGNGTRLLLQNNRLAPNGFVGLQQWDDPKLGGNNDGILSSEDAGWEDLSLWLDTNSNGISEPSEFIQLHEVGISTLEIMPDERKIYDQHGNWLRFWAWSWIEDSEIHTSKKTMVDVYFKTLELRSSTRSGFNE